MTNTKDGIRDAVTKLGIDEASVNVIRKALFELEMAKSTETRVEILREVIERAMTQQQVLDQDKLYGEANRLRREHGGGDPVFTEAVAQVVSRCGDIVGRNDQ